MSEVDELTQQVVVKPECDIVASRFPEIQEELVKHVTNGVEQLVLDLSEVAMIDSIGLGLLIATHNSLSEKGGKLVVTHASEDLQSLFKTMRLDKHFDMQTEG